MDPAHEPAWTEHEKVYLLAEIVKAAPVPSHVLHALIRDSNIHPRWNDIALPRGRSLRSCQMAYADLTATLDPRRPPLPASIPYPGPDMTKKRPFLPESTPAPGRLLQPRPPHSYHGEYGTGPAYTTTAMSPVMSEPASKKKRGRPTKAEAQQRAQAAAARGEVYPPPRKARTSISTAESPQGDAYMGIQISPSAGPPMLSGAMTPQQTHPEPSHGFPLAPKRRDQSPPLEMEKTQYTPHDTELASGAADSSRSVAFSSATPISAPLPPAPEPRDRDARMDGVEESLPRTTTPHSFKDTVGI